MFTELAIKTKARNIKSNKILSVSGEKIVKAISSGMSLLGGNQSLQKAIK